MNLLSIILFPIIFILGYLAGRYFAIIRIANLPPDTKDITAEITTALREAINPTRTRVISPSKKAQANLAEFEKDVI